MKKSEATQERILEAATEEFARYGIAGARVDRIATAASGNKSLIYMYFGSKAALFEAVLKRHTQRVMDEVPFTPEDLPQYAVKIFDFMIDRPQLLRLLTWYSLEQEDGKPADRGTVYDVKLKQVAAAQKAGGVDKSFSPAFLLMAIMALTSAYSEINPFRDTIDPEAKKNLPKVRKTIRKAIERLCIAQ